MRARIPAYPVYGLLALLFALSFPLALAAGPGKITDPVVELGQETHCGIETPQLQLLRPGNVGLTATELGLSDSLQKSVDQALARHRLVLVVALGQKPTPGFAARLKQVELLGGNVLGIAMESLEPGEDKILPQVITTPCTLLSLPFRAWKELQVSLIRDGFPQSLSHPWRHRP